MSERISDFHVCHVSAREHYFHDLPPHIDQDLVERTRAQGGGCGGPLDSARYPHMPHVVRVLSGARSC